MHSHCKHIDAQHEWCRMRKIIAYYRVSTKKQGQSGLGLDAQKAAAEAYAKGIHGIIIAEYTEVETGKKADRPELNKALEHARAANALLVVAKLDRLARNVRFVATLMDSEVDFVCCDNPFGNRLQMHILAAVAEDEAMRISRRTRDSLAAAKRQGVKLGSQRPGHWEGREHLRGYKKAARVSADRRAQRAMDAYKAILPLIEEQVKAGKSFEEIAQVLNQKGYETQKATPFIASTVWRIHKRAQEAQHVA